mmetsp:Transcript_41505/g.39928  ORF Transcript_41505/g.39928 Transcript_41505/m.39928 type:complete len:177 (+) Transcript_41505:540-1070(+)
MRIVSLGFLFNGKYSYLRNPWNMIDFIIVIFSLAAFSDTDSNLKLIKIFRVMKPLRIISKNKSLKAAVIALIMAIPNIFTILITVLLFFVIFGIVGVSQMKGLFFYCNTEHLITQLESGLVNNIWDCSNQGGIWTNSRNNFDNIFAAIVTLFQVASTQSWSRIMLDGVSTTVIDHI